MIFHDVILHGDGIEIRESPPPVIIELYDYSVPGKSKLIGKAIEFPLVMLKNESYSPPKFPPKLQWCSIYSGSVEEAELLAAFELLQLEESHTCMAGQTPFEIDLCTILHIPENIRPALTKHRLEVLFWGIRKLRRFNLKNIERPRIDICCMGTIIQSSPITNCKNNPNFTRKTNYIDLDLPEQVSFWPPLTINLIDCKSFGRVVLVASHIVNTFHDYILKPVSHSNNEEHLLSFDSSEFEDMADSFAVHTMLLPWVKKHINDIIDDEEEEELDWWSRYNSSKQILEDCKRGNVSFNPADVLGDMMKRNGSGDFVDNDLKTSQQKFLPVESIIDMEPSPGKPLDDALLFTVYPCELENVPEFGGFHEWMHSFELTRTSRMMGVKRQKIAGVFKGCFRAYKPPLESNVMDAHLPFHSTHGTIFHGLPGNEPRKVLVRVYIVKAIDLSPADANNSSDPYIVIKLGNQVFSDKENYISKQLNPTFGKCFEFTSNLPWDYQLVVQVFDWDLVGSDDLIGETLIDLENRFYSRHRPRCGLAHFYEKDGPNAWRDGVTPSEILSQLCQENKLDGPHFTEDKIRIGKTIYDFNSSTKDEWKLYADEIQTVENMSLHLLHQWSKIAPTKYQLTPEHVETRTLYHPDKPGEPQGKLEMWVDIFPEDEIPPILTRDISPRKPLSFELRVIIWNADDVILVDDNFFTGEKMSDIYVKGWLEGTTDIQCTDVHYKSMTGEGNFNWRFIYRFDYLPIEKQIVVMKKSTILSWDFTEFKYPPKMHLEVWDADHFSADECLGSLILDLHCLPKGSQTSKLCTLEMLEKTSAVPHVSIFKQPRIKGWWPFSNENNGKMELTGKVEAEFHLLTKEQAEESPAGLARREPEPLELPDRPETSSFHFMNPWKTFRYTIWKNFKWMILKAIAIFLLLLIILLFIYAFPGYAVKKMLGA